MEEDDPEMIPESGERRMSYWLLIPFILIVVWGVWALWAYWDGASGAVDRGYWRKLQRAANTTFHKE